MTGSIKISELPEIFVATAADLLPVVSVITPGDPSQDVTSKITVTNFLNSIIVDTASYADTASYSFTAVSASYVSLPATYSQAYTASYALNMPEISPSSSWASSSVSASYAITASYILGGATVESASYSSYAATASYVLNGGGSTFPYTGDAVISGSLEITKTEAPNFFLIKSASFDAIKVTGSGVLVFGEFSSTPTAVAGGMFYSSSGEFYLGY